MNDKFIKEVFNQYFNGDMNFVTPNVYGYGVYFYDKFNVVLFEKSVNDEHTLYGATALLFNPKSNICCRIDLSDCFEDSKKLNDYISNLSKEDFDNALRYGLDKKIII